ncbi:MAG TPA: hypothetical protein VFW87_09205 [Pirellulales bacterium]|nr:hypothetical protein [Pirellulales bacterium]
MTAATGAFAQQQRVRFPSAIPPDSPFYGEPNPAPAFTAPSAQTAPPPFDPYADPASQPPALTPYGAAPAASPSGPFAQPYSAQPAGPVGAPGTMSVAPPGEPLPDGALAPRRRFLQELHLDDTQLLRFGPRGLGINDVGLDGVFAVPVLAIATPVFITPGFTYHSWNGPSSGNFRGFPDLPPNAYDAYLDTSWHPQLTSWFAADLDVRVGVYSDFSAVNGRSIRVLGRGLGVFTLSPQWQVAAGIWYLDRLTVKILPAGGVIWTPNQDTRFALTFPNPKLSQRLFTIGNTDVWGYVAGEYGGGKWTIRRANGASDVMELNDLRALAGFEWFALSGMKGNAEIGYVFDRHIIYRSDTPRAHPSDTVLFRAGITY